MAGRAGRPAVFNGAKAAKSSITEDVRSREVGPYGVNARRRVPIIPQSQPRQVVCSSYKSSSTIS